MVNERLTAFFQCAAAAPTARFADAVREWITAVGAHTAYIEPGSLWENGYIESFNARFRDELLNGEIFYTLKEAQTVIVQWRRYYNIVRLHSALGYKARVVPPSPTHPVIGGIENCVAGEATEQHRPRIDEAAGLVKMWTPDASEVRKGSQMPYTAPLS